MRGGDHEDDMVVLVDFVEEPPSPDSIAPGVRLERLELADVGTEVRVVPQAGIDNLFQFADDLRVARPGYAMQVFGELKGLEYTVITQRSALDPRGPVATLAAASSSGDYPP